MNNSPSHTLQQKTPSRYLFAILLLLLGLFWLGAQALDSRPIWSDEQWSIYYAGGSPYDPLSLDQVWNKVAQEDPVMSPGYVMLLNQWMLIFGPTPAVLRLISVFAALLVVALTYRIGAETVSRRTGLFAALLLGTSVLFLYYASEMRVYMLLTLAGMFGVWIYLQLVKKPAQRQVLLLIALALLVGCLFYLHYFGAFTVGIIALYHLFFIPKNKRWWTITFAVVIGILLFIPWMPVLLAGFQQFGSEVDVQQRALATGPLLTHIGALLSNGLPILLPVFIIAFADLRQRGTRTIVFLALSMFIAMLLMNAVLRNIPSSRLRYLLITWPLLMLLAATGLNWLSQRRYGRITAIALVTIISVAGIMNHRNPTLISEFGGARHIYPFHRLLRDMTIQAQENDLLVNYWPDAMVDLNNRVVEYYFEQSPTTSVIVVNDPAPSRWEQQSDVLPFLLEDRRRIWIAHMPNFPVQQSAEFAGMQTRLQNNYGLCEIAEDTTDFWLGLYAEPGYCCTPSASGETLLSFGEGMIRLSGVDYALDSKELTVTLGWALREDVPIHVYSASLQLLNAAGEHVFQTDYGIAPQAYVCQTSVMDLGEVPPGEYSLHVTLYAWQTGERLAGLSVDGQTGDLLPVTTITLE